MEVSGNPLKKLYEYFEKLRIISSFARISLLNYALSFHDLSFRKGLNPLLPEFFLS